MRRDIKAIVVAHRMDPNRREFYVEGRRDRFFFTWLLAKQREKNAILVEIEMVEMEEPEEGGFRAKLFGFASAIASHKLHIHCFADADFDRILGRPCPENISLTDRRDLEGYFLQIPCIEKVLHLAAVSDKFTAQHVLDQVFGVARPVGVLRLLSEKEKLRLPFQRCPVKRYLIREDCELSLKFDSYIQALLQDAGISLKALTDIKLKHDNLVKETKNIPNVDMAHGKDCVAALEVLLKSPTFKNDAVEPSCWMSLETGLLSGFPSLQTALCYLQL